MKKLLTSVVLLFLTTIAIAQTDGITYQAVIIGPEDLELPGVDSEGNYLPNVTIAIRFTIYDSGNQIEFQEVQITDTDEFGRINLLIGDANHDYFKEISWDGTPKDLKVEIDFDAGNNFETLSRERLTFLPYAYHRNITATGTLTVDEKTFLNGEMEVQGPTNLFDELTVHDNVPTVLTGTLNVNGQTDLNGAFNVNNASPSNLSGDLTVQGNTAINQNLDVLTGLTTLDDLKVNGQASFGDLTANYLVVSDSTRLQGKTVIDGLGQQIRIVSAINTTEQGYARYYEHPLLIDGGTNGLAIRINESRNNGTNFITFYDSERDAPWGRIEGERVDEFVNNQDYEFSLETLQYDSYDAIFDTGVASYEFLKSLGEVGIASTSSTPCVGFGACVTAPIPSWIIGSTAQSIVAALQIVAAAVGVDITQDNLNYYEEYKASLEGVTYASGAGDYAEYLLRADISEKMTYGDIVGVVGGKISKDLTNADRMMVVSYKPIVLGNMPDPKRESQYEKVAFMGQIPVKVFGKVNIGDYIIPSGKNDGVGLAIKPEYITTGQLEKIVGVAWTESKDAMGIRLINTAVGINNNDSRFIIEKLENKVDQQAKEITYLKGQLERILNRIEGIESGSYQENIATSEKESHSKYEIIESPENDIIYHEITREDFEKGLVLAEEMILGSNKNGENKRLVEALNRLKTDANFKSKTFDMIQRELSKQLHYHQKVDKKGRH